MFKKEKIIPILKEIVETVVIVVVLVALIRTYIGEPRWIPSASMHPTLIEGDRLFIEKLSQYQRPVQRGDILVFYPPNENLKQDLWSKFTRVTGFFNKDIAYIKRVIGVSGDLLEVKKGEGVFINNKKLNEDYTEDEPIMGCSNNMYCNIKIPKNSYFMMGDNRNNSHDSRFWGVLPADRVIGRAYFMFWPINRAKILKTPSYK